MSDLFGYDVETVNDHPENLDCPLCKNILRETIQTNRGIRACKACYKKASEGLNRVCPVDNGSETITFKDKHADRQVASLQIYCTNKIAGCEWSESLKNLEDHKKECEFAGAFAAPVAPVVPICITPNGKCPWRCGESVSHGKLIDHLAKCVRATSPNCCPFEALGCPYAGIEPIDQHFARYAINHFRLLVPHVWMNSNTSSGTSPNQGLTELKKSLMDESTRNILLNNEVDHLKVELTDANQKIASLQNDMRSVRSTFDALVKELNLVKQQRSPLEDRVKKLEKSEDNTRSSATLTKAVEENKDKLVNFENKFNSLQTSFSELDLRQQLLENTSLGGRFLWKVDRFKHRMKQAISGQITALHSAPCFTKKFGYKFCARLYLNGDGIGKNTHVSLFFVLMRSEYDALLQWPFGEKVSFKLINYSNENDSVKESFTPDTRSPSFKQPQREMNLAAGCPMFITKEKLESGSFVLDDSIYIETIVGNN